jgi:hypothetical protein
VKEIEEVVVNGANPIAEARSIVVYDVIPEDG